MIVSGRITDGTPQYLTIQVPYDPPVRDVEMG